LGIRSFYGSSGGTSESPSPSSPSSLAKGDASVPKDQLEEQSTENLTTDSETKSGTGTTSPQLNRSNSRKISKINLKKLKIW